MVIRICMCACGHFGVQDVEEMPTCLTCGTEDVDWINVESKDLKADLATATSTLSTMVKLAKKE